MKIHQVSQNSIAWLELHLGIPTASVFDRLVTPGFEIRKGEMPKTLLAQKVAEKWRGEPLLDLNTFSVEQGTIIEDEARPFFTLHTGKGVDKVGFISSDDGKCGCSPDGLIEGGEVGLEIKCPAVHTHTKYLLNGVLPPEYAAQVYGSLYVTGFERWIFMSYRRGFPPLIVEVVREKKIMEVIGKAVDEFTKNMDRAMKRIKAIEEGGEMGPWEVVK